MTKLAVSTPEENPMIRGILLALLLLSAHGLAGCDGKPAAGAAPPPPSVTVARPLQKTITEWDEYTGRFAAVETVEVRARVSGFIDSVHFKEGQIVKQGDLLFVIDPRPYRLAVEQAKADVERVEGKARHRHARRAARHAIGAQPSRDRTRVRYPARHRTRRRGSGRFARGGAQAGGAQSRLDRGACADSRPHLR